MLLISASTVQADNGDEFIVDNLKYKIISETDKTVELVKWNGTKPSGNLDIPSSANDYSVTSIGNEAFYYCKNLTSVTISEGVTVIGEHAFDECTSLTSVTIPKSVTSIGEWTFSKCTSLTSVTIPKSVTSIGNEAFYNCTSLTSVTIPESVTSIGNEAFYKCTSLTSVTIPESVTSIGKRAFYGCTSLTSVTIPEGVTSIEERAFGACSSLTSVTIPESVTAIGFGAFSDCTSLTSVTIPESVTSIGVYAFSDCTSLTSVTIPESVTAIGEWAFGKCSSLTSVTIPESVTSIGEYAFSDCTSLTSVTIPESVTSIGEYAFNNCESLTSVTIPESVTAIGEWAFGKCSSLTSVTIPESVTSIGKRAFYDVRHIINKSKCTDADHWGAIHEGGIVYGDFVYEDDTKLLVYIGKGGEVTIPKGVTTIGQEAFRNCTSLTSVTIPESVTSIGKEAFYECTNVENVYLYANPANLAWNEVGKDDFKESGETKCHVLAEYVDKYKTKFKDEVNVTFEGDVIQLTADYINTSKISDVTYTGKAFTPEIEVKYGDKTLTPGTDYTITYTNNINAGTAKATITGITNLCIGSRDIEFTIAPAPVSVAAENKSKKFGESDPELTTKVSGLVNNESADLIKYTLTRKEGENVGEYTITPNGEEKQGNYAVSFVDATLTITKANPEYTVPTIADLPCTGKLTDITLPEGFAFAQNSEVLSIGENKRMLVFTPKDVDNYNVISDIEVTITVKDHEYNTPTYTWANDGKTCTATVVCKNDKSHTITETATITSKVTSPATTSAKGTTTYTATFKNTLFATQTKAVEDIDKLPEPEPEPQPEPEPEPQPEPQPEPEPEPQPEPEPDPQNPSTPVSSIDNGGNNVKVWSYARTIYIASAPDSQYKIIDLQGRTIATSTTKSTYEQININKEGVYVVIINGKTFKLSL